MKVSEAFTTMWDFLIQTFKGNEKYKKVLDQFTPFESLPVHERMVKMKTLLEPWKKSNFDDAYTIPLQGLIFEDTELKELTKSRKCLRGIHELLNFREKESDVVDI